jgi:hypothetical protein
MRRISLLLIGAVLASCTTAVAEQPTRTAKGQQEFDRLIAGKVAGPPQNCLATFNTNDMVIIDDETIAFRQGSNRVYVNHLHSGCNGIASGFNALVTRQSSGSSLCRGDIAESRNVTSNLTTGSCVMGDFIPYTRAG